MALKASDLSVGDTYSECLVEDLKRTQIVQYAGASGDYNPLHTDEMYAAQSVHKGVLAHGMTETCPGHATMLTGSHPATAAIASGR